MGRLTVTEQTDQKHREDLQRLKNFRLLDDDFLTKCFEGDTAGIVLVLQIILEKMDLKVLDVHTQVFVDNLLNRSVRLDILATDSSRVKLNVEIQREDKGAGRRRARWRLPWRYADREVDARFFLYRCSGYVLWEIGRKGKIFQGE